MIAARDRVAGVVRRTPLLAPRGAVRPLVDGDRLRLKLEQLQVTGTFKARGAANATLRLDPVALARGVVTASGGNHGLALAWAAQARGAPCVVYLPGRAPPAKETLLRARGAEVHRVGQDWDDAHAAATERAAKDGLTYVHPFADRDVIAGAGTIGLELLDEAPDLSAVLVGVGGGGLLAGVALAVRSLRPDVKVIGVEPRGAPTLHASLAAGEVVTLPSISTAAGSLAPRRSAELNLELIRRHVDGVVLVEDDDLRAAARWLWDEAGVAAELGGSAAIAALLSKRFEAPPAGVVAAVICGKGTDGI